VTISCPLDCEHLRESRLREKMPIVNPDDFPNKDVRITEQFLSEHEPLVLFLSISLAAASVAAPGTIDFDVREALEALIQTYRTLESGLYYESKPINPLAAHVYEEIQKSIALFRERSEENKLRTMRDAEILGVLVFLQQMERRHNNGRRKGRAFIDFLSGYFPAKPAERVLAE
jgi:hypothetical protein